MANITITIPDGVIADVRSAVERLYGEAVTGMTDKQKLAHHLRVTLTPSVRIIRRATDPTLQAAMTARAANNLTRSSAAASDASSVASAEADADQTSDTEIAGLA